MKVSLLLRNGKNTSGDHRCRIDIIADILNASRGGAKRTHLMYQCNLSFRQLKSYSHFLLKMGFLRLVIKERESDGGAYEVTEKGKKFLQAYRGLKSLMQ